MTIYVALGRKQVQVVNPATEVVSELDTTPIEDIQKTVDSARQNQFSWSELSVQDRASCLAGIGELISERADLLASSITEDMGRPIKKSRAEVARAASESGFFVEKAVDWLSPEPAEDVGYLRFDPLGVVGIISPWNVPLAVPLLAIMPALLAGNAVVFKPSENALRIGIEIGKLFDALAERVDALPAGLVQVIVGGKDHGRVLVETDVDMISFTGSTRVGKEIMKVSAERVRPVLLELGGMDAAIVLKDADLSQAARQLVQNNCNNTGQICCAVKRVFVEREAYDDFVMHAVEQSKSMTIGDPKTDVDMGPLVADFQLAKVEKTVADAREKGATIHSGGERPEGDGYFYPSTVVTDVTDDMLIMNEEPFGPLLPIVPVDSWEDGVRLANSSRYGLTGSVWTQDQKLGETVAAKLEVGVASLNKHGLGPVGTPFGGAKESGLGRIKHKEGMRAYTNVKLVRV